MSKPHTPLLPLTDPDDAMLAAADALLSATRMGNRARLLLARSAQVQALHGQALQAVRSQPGGALQPAMALAGSGVQGVLAQSAAEAVVATHQQLAAAAAQARQLAAADPLLARLQAAIDGQAPAQLVVDVQATEVVEAGTHAADSRHAKPAESPTANPAGAAT